MYEVGLRPRSLVHSTARGGSSSTERALLPPELEHLTEVVARHAEGYKMSKALSYLVSFIVGRQAEQGRVVVIWKNVLQAPAVKWPQFSLQLSGSGLPAVT